MIPRYQLRGVLSEIAYMCEEVNKVLLFGPSKLKIIISMLIFFQDNSCFLSKK